MSPIDVAEEYREMLLQSNAQVKFLCQLADGQQKRIDELLRKIDLMFSSWDDSEPATIVDVPGIVQ